MFEAYFLEENYIFFYCSFHADFLDYFTLIKLFIIIYRKIIKVIHIKDNFSNENRNYISNKIFYEQDDSNDNFSNNSYSSISGQHSDNSDNNYNDNKLSDDYSNDINSSDGAYSESIESHVSSGDNSYYWMYWNTLCLFILFEILCNWNSTIAIYILFCLHIYSVHPFYCSSSLHNINGVDGIDILKT